MNENEHAHDGHDDHGDLPRFNHPVSVPLLLAVFFCLVGLTILTVVVNDFGLGQLDIWAALLIASVKASIVCLFFMHMFWEKGFNVLAFLSSLFFVTLFIGLTLMDTRAYRDSQDKFPLDKRPEPTVTRDAPSS